MSLWSRSSTRTYLLEGNGFVTSDGGKKAKVPGPTDYNQPSMPWIRGPTAMAHVHGKTDREKILSNGARLDTMSPLGPGTYNPKRVVGPGSARTNPASDKKAKPFGSGTKRRELYPDNNMPGPTDYNLSLPSLSNRGNFFDTSPDTSPRKCYSCSPVQKENVPTDELSPTQQQWTPSRRRPLSPTQQQWTPSRPGVPLQRTKFTCNPLPTSPSPSPRPCVSSWVSTSDSTSWSRRR